MFLQKKSHQLQTHKKRGGKASCYFARSAANCINKRNVRSVQSAVWHRKASHFNKKGQFFCEKVLSPLHSGQAEKCLNNLIFSLCDCVRAHVRVRVCWCFKSMEIRVSSKWSPGSSAEFEVQMLNLFNLLTNMHISSILSASFP